MDIMDINECRMVVASNIIRLRTNAGLTQAELGERLNYSDKSVSKWERAAALPDALVLRQIGNLFGVTVDFLLEEHSDSGLPNDEFKKMAEKDDDINYNAIIAVTAVGIWTVAVLVFVVLWLLGWIVWLVFGCAVVASIVCVLIMNSVWRQGRQNVFIVMALVLSIILLIYLIFMQWNVWQLFLVLIPAEILVFFAFRIRKNH